MTCLSAPVSKSLRRLNIQGGMPALLGSLMNVSKWLASASVSVPARRLASILARLQTVCAKETPMPFIFESAKRIVLLPLRSVCAILTRCLKFDGGSGVCSAMVSARRKN